MRALLLAVALLLPMDAAAQTGEPRAQADRLTAILIERGVGAFVDTVLTETPLGTDANARRNIEQNRERWEREFANLGKPVDVVHAGERAYAPVFRTLCYVVRFPRVPLFVNLRYYRSPQRWELLHYGWHDNVANWECAAGAPLVPPAN